ncbi:MAG: MoxR family ATPase [Candidatus Micrarchaeota archaeon]|nr:MoxR family ATPase [Candidatus Micrarchaeota archaeon]
MPGLNANDVYKRILAEMEKHIAGKQDTMELMIIALVANGHALLEGVPGVAKTTMTKALASTLQADFKRIQGTPDLEPKDIVGYTYIDADQSIKLNKGPVFTNLLLVDEMNRAPPKTMAALLESLEERQVTIAGNAIPLPRPFTAFATQNPLTIEGTEPIPKVLSDRFLMKIPVDYPSMEEEQEMLRIKETEEKIEVKKVTDTSGVLDLQAQAKLVQMPDDAAEYITRIVNATRKDIHAIMGGSPRADIAFMQAGKAKALLEGRDRVTKEDIKFLAKPVLSHRIAVRSTGGIGVHGIIDGILATLG